MTASNTAELRRLLKQMGFSEHEITPFFTDILYYINQKGRPSKMELNTEMESLGWGIGVIDEAIYARINSFINALS